MDHTRHAGRIALVTGAGRGIGRATAMRLAAEGATVLVNDIDSDAGGETVDLLRGATPDRDPVHRFIAADVADVEQVDAMFAIADEHAGRVDILVSNAAVSRTPSDGRDRREELSAERQRQLAAGETPTVFADHLLHMEPEGWARMTAVNLDSAFYCSRAALRIMCRERIQGAIVCIASIAARNGMGPPHYAAAKGGVVGLVRSLARELGPRGIRINAVAPGPVDTPMMRSVPGGGDVVRAVPLGRVGQPDDIAAAVSFLASDDAAFITGVTLDVNGGLHIG